jgi:hypothetical protein
VLKPWASGDDPVAGRPDDATVVAADPDEFAEPSDVEAV